MKNTMYSRLLVCLFALTSLTTNALQAQYDQAGQVVIQKKTLSIYEWNHFVRLCEAVEMRWNIPAVVLIGIALHETGHFSSKLYKNSNNTFGILGRRDWDDKPTYKMQHRKWNSYTQTYELIDTPFRMYPTLAEAVYDFPNFISKSWYDNARECGGDVSCWLQELAKSGYAEDKQWAAEIEELLVRYGLMKKISRPSLPRA